MNNAAQAKSIVAASRFPPKGIRGFGSPFTQDSWGLSAKEYLTQANDAVIVLVQIETKESVENMEEILATEGLGKYYSRKFYTVSSYSSLLRRCFHWTI